MHQHRERDRGLRREREAAARYSSHPPASSDPRLVTYWESLRRNEAAAMNFAGEVDFFPARGESDVRAFAQDKTHPSEGT